MRKGRRIARADLRGKGAGGPGHAHLGMVSAAFQYWTRPPFFPIIKGKSTSRKAAGRAGDLPWLQSDDEEERR